MVEFNADELEEMSIAAIKNYLNVVDNAKFTDEYIRKNYSMAIKVISNNIKTSIGVDTRVASMSEGSRSISYNTNASIDLIGSAKDLLPKPFVRLF